MDRTVLTTIKVALTTLAILFVLLVLWRLGPVFATLFVSLFLVLSVESGVKGLMSKTFMNRPVSRGAAVLLTYSFLTLGIVLILTIGFPPVLAQSQKFLQNLNGVIENIPMFQEMDVSVNNFAPQISELSGKLLDSTASVFSGFTAAVTVLIFSIYMSLDWENLKKRLFSLFSGRSKTVAEVIVNEIEADIGNWVKGQLLLMLVIGLASFFGLLLLGIDYPVALGLIAGLLEAVPMIGPLFTWVLAVLVGFSISPAKGIMAAVLFYLIQQLENSFLVPRIMGKVSGFSPLIVLMAVLVGGTFFGVIGIILAVPITMTAVVIVRNLLTYSS